MPQPLTTPAPQPIRPIRQLRRGPILQIGSPHGFEWNTYELPIHDLAPALDGLRIIHLTDVHLRPHWRRAYDELLTRIADANADFLFLTGDLVEHKFNHRPTLPIAERFCAGLRAKRGVYVTLGNHDGDLLAGHLLRFGLQLINRKVAHFEIDGAPVELIGVPGVLRTDIPGFVAEINNVSNVNQVNVTRATPGESMADRPRPLRLTLTHYPDSILLLRELNPDVVFAGHTHGGQVCLPTLHPPGIPIIRHDKLPRALCSGVFRFDSSWLVISRGFGFATWEIRAFCPSEVIEVVLRRG